MVRLLQVVAQLRLQKNITTEKAIGAEAVQQQSIRPDAGQVISQECLFKLLSKVIGQVLRQNAAKVHCCQSAWHQNCTRDALKLHGQLHKRHIQRWCTRVVLQLGLQIQPRSPNWPWTNWWASFWAWLHMVAWAPCKWAARSIALVYLLAQHWHRRVSCRRACGSRSSSSSSPWHRARCQRSWTGAVSVGLSGSNFLHLPWSMWLRTPPRVWKAIPQCAQTGWPSWLSLASCQSALIKPWTSCKWLWSWAALSHWIPQISQSSACVTGTAASVCSSATCKAIMATWNHTLQECVLEVQWCVQVWRPPMVSVQDLGQSVGDPIGLHRSPPDSHAGHGSWNYAKWKRTYGSAYTGGGRSPWSKTCLEYVCDTVSSHGSCTSMIPSSVTSVRLMSMRREQYTKMQLKTMTCSCFSYLLSEESSPWNRPDANSDFEGFVRNGYMFFFHLSHEGYAYWVHRHNCTTQALQVGHLRLRVLRDFFSACHRCLASGLSPTFQAKTAAKALQNDPESFAASVCLPAFVQRCGDLWCVSDAYIFSVTVIEFSQFCQPFPEEKLTCHSHLKSLRVLELNFHLQSLNLTPPLHGFVHASTLLRCFLPLWR